MTFDGELGKHQEWDCWKLCYRVARDFQDCTFSDALIDMIIEKMVAADAYHLLQHFIYRYTDSRSPHRKLAVDLAVNAWHDWVLEDIGSIDNPFPDPHEFFTDVIAAFAVKGRAARIEHVSPREFFKDIDTCIYHEHTITEITRSIIPCYKTK
jgi:hypothetical protein